MRSKWPNATRVADLNADGRQDVIVGTGFLTCQLVRWTAPCGGLIWFEQTADGWVRHDVISPGNERFIHEGCPSTSTKMVTSTWSASLSR